MIIRPLCCLAKGAHLHGSVCFSCKLLHQMGFFDPGALAYFRKGGLVGHDLAKRGFSSLNLPLISASASLSHGYADSRSDSFVALLSAALFAMMDASSDLYIRILFSELLHELRFDLAAALAQLFYAIYKSSLSGGWCCFLRILYENHS